ncbi:MATE family efflux transporter [Clostridium bornimense]|uniref:MATE family efflux transporter n=1 Tax=Clostridium bornimense TaxID=1216932 RepID=UPI001C123B44|nr:MATE family efflux transporter [Clostridium bornimense]MBU5317880.1 MATE family efflux transporter [Clostridium bornimense]
MNDTKNFYRMVFALVIPIALQNLINVAVTSVDVIMLGKLSETVLSASSLAGQIQYIMTLIFFGITSGAAVLTAQYWGKKDIDTIEKVLGISLRFSLIVSIAFTIITFFFPQALMHIFSSEKEVILEGAKYLRIVCFSYIFSSITMIYLNIMRSVEKVKIATFVYFTSLIINTIFNYIFIFGKFGFPALGIRGAALATTIARITELIIILIYAYKYNHIVKFKFKYIFKTDKLLFNDFLKFSIPVTINELMWGLGTSMNSAIIGHLGSQAAAANSIAQVTRQLATVVAFGISTATAIILGKAIGENKLEEAKSYGKRFVKLSIATGLLGALIILIVRPIAMNTMNLSPIAEGYLSAMMFVMSYFVVCQSYNTTMVVGVFRAGGDTKFGLLIDVTTMWGCSILFGALSAFVFNLNVTIVYMILMCDEVIKIFLTTYRFRSYIWLKNITR